MRKIQLYQRTGGTNFDSKIGPIEELFALVDDEDYEKVRSILWLRCRDTHTDYAISSGKGGVKSVKMHRLIMDVLDDPLIEIDHIDGNGLNNQRSFNLRVASRSQNHANMKLSCASISGLKGVSWHKSRGRWKVCISKDKKTIYLGSFLSRSEASFTYNTAALILHGEFCSLNLIASENLPSEKRRLEIKANVQERLSLFQVEATGNYEFNH